MPDSLFVPIHALKPLYSNDSLFTFKQPFLYLERLSHSVKYCRSNPKDYQPFSYLNCHCLSDYFELLHSLFNTLHSQSLRDSCCQFVKNLTLQCSSFELEDTAFFCHVILQLKLYLSIQSTALDLLIDEHHLSTSLPPTIDSQFPNTCGHRHIGQSEIMCCQKNGRRSQQEDRYFILKAPCWSQCQAPHQLEQIMNALDSVTRDTPSGTTATLVYIYKNHLTISWIGDSPLYLVTQDLKNIHKLTVDHKPDSFFENLLILKKGGQPALQDCWRINGLNMSRAFGNTRNAHIERSSDFLSLPLSQDHYHSLILCSDGLGNGIHINPQKLLNVIRGCTIDSPPQHLSELLVDYSIQHRSSMDNVTCLSLYLNKISKDDPILLAIFDGHGGNEASQLCYDTLQQHSFSGQS